MAVVTVKSPPSVRLPVCVSAPAAEFNVIVALLAFTTPSTVSRLLVKLRSPVTLAVTAPVKLFAAPDRLALVPMMLVAPTTVILPVPVIAVPFIVKVPALLMLPGSVWLPADTKLTLPSVEVIVLLAVVLRLPSVAVNDTSPNEAVRVSVTDKLPVVSVAVTVPATTAPKLRLPAFFNARVPLPMVATTVPSTLL